MREPVGTMADAILRDRDGLPVCAREEEHVWESVGGRACPRELPANCSQVVFRCRHCGVYDYGESAGPGERDCRSRCTFPWNDKRLSRQRRRKLERKPDAEGVVEPPAESTHMPALRAARAPGLVQGKPLRLADPNKPGRFIGIDLARDDDMLNVGYIPLIKI